MIKIGEIIEINDEINFFYKMDRKYFYSITTKGEQNKFSYDTYAYKTFKHNNYSYSEIFTRELLNGLCEIFFSNQVYFFGYQSDFDYNLPLIDKDGSIFLYALENTKNNKYYIIENGYFKIKKAGKIKYLESSDMEFLFKVTAAQISRINFVLFENHFEFREAYNVANILSAKYYNSKKDVMTYYLKDIITSQNCLDFVKAFNIGRNPDYAACLFYVLEARGLDFLINVVTNTYPELYDIDRKIHASLVKDPEKRSKVAKLNFFLATSTNYEILKGFENEYKVESYLPLVFKTILDRTNPEELTIDIIDLIINVINNNHLFNINYSFFLKKLGDNKTYFLDNIPSLTMFPEYGEYVPVSKKLDLIDISNFVEMGNFINDNIDELLKKENVGDLVCFLVKASNHFRYSRYDYDFKRLINNLPDSTILKSYLSHYEYYYDSVIDGMGYFPTEELINKAFFNSIGEIESKEIKEIETYFDFIYKYDKDDITLDFLFMDYNHKHVIYEFKYFARKTFHFERDSFYRNDKSVNKYVFLNYAKYKLGNQLYNDLDSIENYYANKDRIESQIKFNKALRELSTYVEQDDKNLVFEKVKVVPSYSLDGTIDFKIGRDKYYIIKQLNKFIYDVEKTNEVKYGKELVFDNNIDGFDDPSKEIINFIKLNYNNQERSNRIDYDKLVELVNISKGHEFFIDSTKYTVDNDDIDFKIRIDNNGCLSIELKDNYKLLNGIAVSQDELKIKNLNCDKTMKKLCNIIDNNGLASIMEILDEFKYNIYLKYANYFVLDDEIKDKFFFNDVTIKSYFDLDMGKVLVKTKLFQNDVEIKNDNLDSYSLKQYIRYKKLLDAYGFIDGEITDQNSIVNFLLSDLSQLKELSNIYFSESIKNKKINKFEAPRITVKRSGSLAECFVDDSVYSDEELKEILKSIKKKKKYILLNGNNFIILDDAKSKEFYDIVEDFGLDQNNLHEERKMPLYMAFKAKKYENSVNIDDFIKDLIDSIKNFKNDKFVLPTSINANLREYQKNGVKWMKILSDNNLGGILADDMGLGKTLEIITLFNMYKRTKPSLIICPKSLIYNWKSEFEKFAPTNNVVPIYGFESERKEIIKNIKKNSDVIYITGYESFRIDKEAYETKEFMFAVLDEAQYIKNVNAQKTKSVKMINAEHKFALTGTPIENTIIDLWSIFDFIMPGYLENLNEFRSNFDEDNEYSFAVYKKVSPFILRRRKNDVLKDLPEKYDVVITCEMKEEQKKLYEAVRIETKNILETEGRKGVFSILQSLTRLRQICVDPKTYIENYTGGSGKMEYLRKLIKEYIDNGHRLLIFSQFVTALNEVQSYLKEKRIEHLMITGDTSAEKRVQMSKDFNESDEYPVMLVSLKAGGNGLNLIGADTVVHLDPWWNSAAMEQATDRAYRIGQVKNVEVIRLICENTIEQRVVELQNKKKELFDKIISSDESSIEKLSSDDIGYILS